jgi:hypothetical protein
MTHKAASHADWQQCPIVDSVESYASLDVIRANPTASGHSPVPLTATLAAVATATGHNSLTEGSITNCVKAIGNCVVAFGEARAYAAATPSGAMPGSEHTATSLTANGADLVYEAHLTETGHTGPIQWQVSITEYVAIEFLGTRQDSTVSPQALDPTILTRLGLEMAAHLATPHGVIGEIDTTAQASAPDSLAVTATQELSVENHFSCIAGLSTVAF